MLFILPEKDRSQFCPHIWHFHLSSKFDLALSIAQKNPDSVRAQKGQLPRNKM